MLANKVYIWGMMNILMNRSICTLSQSSKLETFFDKDITGVQPGAVGKHIGTTPVWGDSASYQCWTQWVATAMAHVTSHRGHHIGALLQHSAVGLSYCSSLQHRAAARRPGNSKYTAAKGCLHLVQKVRFCTEKPQRDGGYGACVGRRRGGRCQGTNVLHLKLLWSLPGTFWPCHVQLKPSLHYDGMG